MQTQSRFRQQVYNLAKKIPAGKVMTYGQIAVCIGNPGAARAVGTCMRKNPDNTVIPCHRVVASDGSLVEYAFGGITAKKEKLLKEGVHFKKNKVDLQRSQWTP